MISRCAAFAFAFLGCSLTTTAFAGDAAARKVIGFSPDGAYFAFEQYTMVYEDEASFSEYVIVDTRNDRFVPGAPIRILIRGDDGLDEKKARADAKAKAQPLLDRLRIGEPGTRTEGKPSMDLDDIGIYQINQQPMAKSLDIPLPDGRKAQIALSDHPIATVMCEGMGGRGHTRQSQGFWRQADAQDRGRTADCSATRQGAAQEPPNTASQKPICTKRATAPSPSPR